MQFEDKDCIFWICLNMVFIIVIYPNAFYLMVMICLGYSNRSSFIMGFRLRYGMCIVISKSFNLS